MGKIMRNGKKYSGASSSMAENIVYDNTESGLEANDVQGAIDELSSNVDEQNKNLENEIKKINKNIAVLAGGTPGVAYSSEKLDRNAIYLVMIRQTNDDSSWLCTPIVQGRFISNYVSLDGNDYIGLNFQQEWGMGYIIKLCTI